jgi:hypothetical protein
MNIFNLKQFPNDLATKNKFTELNADLQIDMLEIIAQNAFHYLYDIILCFIIQFDLSYALDNVSKYSKKMLIAAVKAFLEKAKDPAVLGSMGQILQTFKNTNDQRAAEFHSFPEQRLLRRWCLLERKTIMPGHKGEPAEFKWRIARVEVLYNVQGTIDTEFQLTTHDLGLKEERWVDTYSHIPDSDNVADHNTTRDRIHSDIHNNIFAPYLKASVDFKEGLNNIERYAVIVHHINDYLKALDNLLLKVEEE